MLTYERLREAMSYDPETGAFTWTTKHGKVEAGDVAGYLTQRGYRDIEIDGRSYRASRLAWLYMTGSWPAHQVDHKDRCCGNDKWGNLRAATNKQNSENRSKRRDGRSSKHTGVHWSTERSCWVAKICHNAKVHLLGRFKNESEAVFARKHAEQRFFTHAGA